MARLRRLHPLLRLFTALWIPFCCCQWQGIAVAWPSDASSIEVSCGSACCQREMPAESPASDTPRGDERCSLECCIRGEVTPPAWEPPVDRVGVERIDVVLTVPLEARRFEIDAQAHPPPRGFSPHRGVPVAASVRLQV